MKNTIKLLKMPILLGIFVVGCYIFSGCSSTRNSQIPKLQKKWVNWEIEFTKDASKVDKAKVLIAIDKYILDYLDSSKIKIISIKFRHIEIKSKNKTSIIVDLRGADSIMGPSTKIPPPKPPKMEPFNSFSPIVIDIKNVGFENEIPKFKD